jgi:hypothetical protein
MRLWGEIIKRGGSRDPLLNETQFGNQQNCRDANRELMPFSVVQIKNIWHLSVGDRGLKKKLSRLSLSLYNHGDPN